MSDPLAVVTDVTPLGPPEGATVGPLRVVYTLLFVDQAPTEGYVEITIDGTTSVADMKTAINDAIIAAAAAKGATLTAARIVTISSLCGA